MTYASFSYVHDLLETTSHSFITSGEEHLVLALLKSPTSMFCVCILAGWFQEVR